MYAIEKRDHRSQYGAVWVRTALAYTPHDAVAVALRIGRLPDMDVRIAIISETSPRRGCRAYTLSR